MNINYTMFYLGKTGGPITICRIMNELAKRGHQVSVTSVWGNIDWLSKEVRQIRPTGLWNKSTLLLLRAVNDVFLKKIVKDDFYFTIYRSQDLLEKIMPECDINVATRCYTAHPVLRSGKGIPFFHVQHDEELLPEDSHKKALARETCQLPLNKIANSTWLKNQIKEKYGQDVPVINPGIDLEIFRPTKTCRQKNKKRIVCYGSNVPWKGFADAIEAMKIVFKKRKDIEWFVYGLSLRLKKTAETPYTFLRHISNNELAKLYSSADVVICPSWYESFPLPPLEAMACEAPVVTTRYGTEDYAFDNENALVVQPRQPKAMAEAVLRILEDKNLSEKLKENGIKTAKKFTWDKTADKVEKLFLNKINRNKT